MAKNKMEPLDWVAIGLLMAGGLNWGLIGLFKFNLVQWAAMGIGWIETTVYVAVGAATVYSGWSLKKVA